MSVRRAKLDEQTCGRCRMLHGRKVGTSGQFAAPPDGKCKSPSGCRCDVVDSLGISASISLRKRRLLWIGDAVVSSGFARCTHKTLEVLKETWDVHVLGLNYLGDPHSYDYPIWPCHPGGDMFGVGRVKSLVKAIEPDLIVIQNDPWNIPAYLDEIGDACPVVASMPVDGRNCRGRALNDLALAVWWTEFGRREAEAGGYKGSSAVIPLGVDLDVYSPKYTRKKARDFLELPKVIRDGFIFGNVNRNQPRKRLDLSIQYFVEWVKEYKVDDAFLMFHVAPTGDEGYDIIQLFKYYGLIRRLILVEPEIGYGVTEDHLVRTYCAFDAQISTTQGEGWGLCTMEGMACGVPQIVPSAAALGEWATAAWRVKCSSTSATPKNINVIGELPDREEFIKALDDVYRSAELRRQMSENGLKLVREQHFRWRSIGEKFADALEKVAPAESRVEA